MGRNNSKKMRSDRDEFKRKKVNGSSGWEKQMMKKLEDIKKDGEKE